MKENIDNANERGKQVDALLSLYAVGMLQRIPAGTRKDAVTLFEKGRRWFDRQGFRKIEAQVLVADDEIGGILDLRLDGMVVDTKCAYELRETYSVQVGGYVALSETATDRAALLHLTERHSEARLIPLKVSEIVADWTTLRTAWAMIQRRANGKI